MNQIEATKPTTASPWLISVILLSLPSVIFLILHALYAPGILPAFLGFVVTWAIIALTGFLGEFLTLTAAVVMQWPPSRTMFHARPRLRCGVWCPYRSWIACTSQRFVHEQEASHAIGHESIAFGFLATDSKQTWA